MAWKRIFATFTLLFVVLLQQSHNYPLNELCTTDADCPATTEMFCNRTTTVLPACQKGLCQCRPGYVYDATQCTQKQNLSLNNACNGGVFERYTWGAICNSSRVACDLTFYQPATPTLCFQVVNQPSFDETCVPLSTNVTDQCNSTRLLSCKTANNKCGCQTTNMIFATDNTACRLRRYGDACSTAADCDSNIYTNLLAAQGGPDCISSNCGCKAGYTNVPRLSYDTTTTTTITICVKNYTDGLTQNATCTLAPEQFSSSGAKICSSSLACFRCPEDNNTVTTEGTCREVVGAACNDLASANVGNKSPKEVESLFLTCAGSSGANGMPYYIDVKATLLSVATYFYYMRQRRTL